MRRKVNAFSGSWIRYRRDMQRMATATDIDPLTLAFTQSRLDHISRQMGWVMLRAARSPISRMHDFSCFIADARGYVISQADGIPIHTGSGGFGVRAILAAFGDRIEQGDVFLLNDPYLAGGNHLPDWVIARPVFVDGALVAVCCNRAHQADIGGGAAGTYNPLATEIFHEGIRLPPLKLLARGQVRDDLWQLLLANTRTPVLVDGDLRAMIGSTEIGARQVTKLFGDLGASAAPDYFEAILDYADRSMRAEIGRLPDGEYVALETMNNDCFTRCEVRIELKLRVLGDRLTVDFSGTSPQMRGFKNSSLANTHAAAYAGISAYFRPDLPRNEGSFRSFEVIAPEGTVINPRPPAATTYCTAFPAHEIIHACWKALGQANSSGACAGWGKATSPISTGTTADGEPFVLYHWGALSGGGAVVGRDGFNQISFLPTLGALLLPNAETWEQDFPVRILQQEFREDGGGAGQWRGGTGVHYEALVELPAQHSLRSEGLFDPSGYGVLGGCPGRSAEMRIEPIGAPTFVPPQYGLIDLPPARISILSAGGGGLGDPMRRTPEVVRSDVLDGLVSLVCARELYGVALVGPDLTVDITSTERLRLAAPL